VDEVGESDESLGWVVVYEGVGDADGPAALAGWQQAGIAARTRRVI